MSQPPPLVTPSVLRYWLTPGFNPDSTFQCGSIRIEWTKDGVTRSEFASFFGDDGHLNWQYGTPPACLAQAARDCCYEAGCCGDVHLPPGCSFEGFEEPTEMERQVAARCTSCGVVQASEAHLSESGDCSRCFVANAPQWLSTLRAAGCM